MKALIKKILQKYNYDIIRTNRGWRIPHDFEKLHRKIFNEVVTHTMTSPERIYSLVEAVNYIEKNHIEGDIVECGVWRGGSMMAVAEILKKHNSFSRQLYLYDTFEGMPEPTEKLDITIHGQDAASLLKQDDNKETNPVWAFSTLDTVRNGMSTTGYPANKITYVKGKVEETIPGIIPREIAILRLDTDWYESTRHELIHLFPLLTMGGVLILDDYGHWQGARKAVDEYFEKNNTRILLNRIDETGRIAIKQT
jgi:O-methyltransferase